MARTELSSGQIRDATIARADLNTVTPGSAVVAKIVAGTGISISQTGADSGTGDVTVSASVTPVAHAPTHETGGTDALTNLSANILSSGTLQNTRISLTTASRLLGRGSSGAGTMEEVSLGTGLAMTGTVLSTTIGGVGGTGTVNKIPKWTAASTLANSIATDDGTFRVAGSMTSNDLTTAAVFVKASSNPVIDFWDLSQAVDAKMFRLIANSAQFWLQSYPDATGPIVNNMVHMRNGDVQFSNLGKLTTGQVAVQPNKAGNALTVFGYNASFTSVVIGGSGSGHGLYIAAGVTAADMIFVVQNRSETRPAIYVTGDSVCQIGWRLVIPVGTDYWAT